MVSNIHISTLLLADNLIISLFFQASERISQVLSSHKKAKITLNKNVITKDEIDSLTLEINPASLIRYLFFEHIDNQMEKEHD